MKAETKVLLATAATYWAYGAPAVLPFAIACEIAGVCRARFEFLWGRVFTPTYILGKRFILVSELRVWCVEHDRGAVSDLATVKLATRRH